jgi:hypothetical protein
MKRTAVGAICALVALCTSALGAGYYTWTWQQLPHPSVKHSQFGLALTENNGSHAVALGEYGNQGYGLPPIC